MKKFEFCRQWSTVLQAGLTLLVILLIWGNSCLSREASGAQSGRITALLLSVIDPNGKISPESFHHFVRKAAHFTEFALLGALVGGLLRRIGQRTDHRFYSLPVLVVLLVAVLDEYIQFFAGRGSMVTDVVLDFSGGLAGLGWDALTRHLLKKR